MLRIAALILAYLIALLVLAWGALALHFAGPTALATALPIAWIAAGMALLIWVRPPWRALLLFAAAFAILLLWWNQLEPRNDRDWQEDVARPPTGEMHGDRLTMHNVRNFDYRSETDFTPRWETRTYDLSQLRGLDLFLSHWGSPAIAHTIMSWDFGGDQHLAVSIETRKEKGESYSAVAGFFKQYELYYVAADERDLIRLRTNFRGEDVYLYHLRVAAPAARSLLLDYVQRMNALAATPVFYDAATQNCTTTIRMHTQHIGAARPWDWRFLVNGYIDQFLYEQGRLDTDLPFADLHARSQINQRAQAADEAEFSARIREGLPQPLPAP
ncbi:MAG TPA: DUF4105 domain-containing protein [Candidatus Dormibacteraeota bacterium]|nr:DUF4105 domain-containing protein [Candidatus Dormibacteraeota bacterium]